MLAAETCIQVLMKPLQFILNTFVASEDDDDFVQRSEDRTVRFWLARQVPTITYYSAKHVSFQFQTIAVPVEPMR